MKKNLFLPVLAAICALVIAQIACAAGGPPAVGEVVSAKDLDASYKPVDPTATYKPSDTFKISVEVQNIEVGNIVNVKYVFDGEEYYASTLTADQEGSGYYGFTLQPSSDGHAIGQYTVEVSLNGKLEKSITFTVEAD